MNSSGSGTSRACRSPQHRVDVLSSGHVPPSLDRFADRVSWTILSGCVCPSGGGIVPRQDLLARGMCDRVRTRLTGGVEDQHGKFVLRERCPGALERQATRQPVGVHAFRCDMGRNLAVPPDCVIALRHQGHDERPLARTPQRLRHPRDRVAVRRVHPTSPRPRPWVTEGVFCLGDEAPALRMAGIGADIEFQVAERIGVIEERHRCFDIVGIAVFRLGEGEPWERPIGEEEFLHHPVLAALHRDREVLKPQVGGALQDLRAPIEGH
jgi:hypothetical protein